MIADGSFSKPTLELTVTAAIGWYLRKRHGGYRITGVNRRDYRLSQLQRLVP